MNSTLKKERESVNALAPRPVHPRAVRTHGLFGIPFVRQHMVVDSRWTPASLTEQFKGMTDLLSKRLVFKQLEFVNKRKDATREYRNLRHQCRDGRNKLQMSLSGSNTKNIRNFLINHKDMQRLYQRMPIHLVVDNINQRTFAMRKERDRLRYRLAQLEKDYKCQLIRRATLENRIKYENEFVLDEEIQSREFRKKIENSNVRLKAIKTINGTYKKMIQVLRHDSIFYEPILRSLSADIEDQAQFIKHILFLGTPAIAKFKELSEDYRQIEDRHRKSIQGKSQWMANFRKSESKRMTQSVKIKPNDMMAMLKRYVRETDSMLVLKTELEAIEDTIKQVKIVTLCSQAKEIFPRMKAQVDNNEKLHKKIENDVLGYETLEIKKKRAEVLNDVLVNNLTDEETARLKRAEELESQIRQEEEYEAKTLAYLKNRADAFVLLRYSLWNIIEILRHVDRSPKSTRQPYPEPYLQLPLLKFEMLTMRACPPDSYEQNIDELLALVKRKVQRLMSAYKTEISKSEIERNNDEYHYLFLQSMDADELVDGDEVQPPVDDGEDLLQDAKTMLNVPNRKQIKAQSVKLVEEHAKKEEQQQQQ